MFSPAGYDIDPIGVPDSGLDCGILVQLRRTKDAVLAPDVLLLPDLFLALIALFGGLEGLGLGLRPPAPLDKKRARPIYSQEFPHFCADNVRCWTLSFVRVHVCLLYVQLRLVRFVSGLSVCNG